MNHIDPDIIAYLSKINKIPLLTRQEEFQTAIKAKNGDKQAKQKLVLANLRFVFKTAKGYINCGLPLDDLISEGNLGLIRSVETFDPNKGFHFISYAVYWIKQSILKAISEKSKIVRLPLALNNNLAVIEKNLREERTDNLSDKSLETISKQIKMDKKEVIHLIKVTRKPSSLDKIIDNSRDRNQIKDFIANEDSFPADGPLMECSLKENLALSLQCLSEYEAEILKERFGLNGDSPKTLLEIGETRGVTKERIRQIEKQALEKLRALNTVQELKSYVA